MTNKKELIDKLDPNKVKCTYCKRYIEKKRAVYWNDKQWFCINTEECCNNSEGLIQEKLNDNL